MHEADKIWNHFKGLRPVQKYNQDNRYTLRMGTFTDNVVEQIEFKADLVIDEEKLEHDGKIYQGVLEDLLPEWLADHTNKIKKIHIKFNSCERLKFIFMYLYTRFEYPIQILFDEFANWELKGSKREFTNHNIKALFEWSNENDKQLEIVQRDHKQGAVVEIISKP
jgi:hypothetical protein